MPEEPRALTHSQWRALCVQLAEKARSEAAYGRALADEVERLTKLLKRAEKTGNTVDVDVLGRTLAEAIATSMTKKARKG